VVILSLACECLCAIFESVILVRAINSTCDRGGCRGLLVQSVRSIPPFRDGLRSVPQVDGKPCRSVLRLNQSSAVLRLVFRAPTRQTFPRGPSRSLRLAGSLPPGRFGDEARTQPVAHRVQLVKVPQAQSATCHSVIPGGHVLSILVRGVSFPHDTTEE
jgi:hypothetical protein